MAERLFSEQSAELWRRLQNGKVQRDLVLDALVEQGRRLKETMKNLTPEQINELPMRDWPCPECGEPQHRHDGGGGPGWCSLTDGGVADRVYAKIRHLR